LPKNKAIKETCLYLWLESVRIEQNHLLFGPFSLIKHVTRYGIDQVWGGNKTKKYCAPFGVLFFGFTVRVI
jgi:hypothetical protein